MNRRCASPRGVGLPACPFPKSRAIADKRGLGGLAYGAAVRVAVLTICLSSALYAQPPIPWPPARTDFSLRLANPRPYHVGERIGIELNLPAPEPPPAP